MIPMRMAAEIIMSHYRPQPLPCTEPSAAPLEHALIRVIDEIHTGLRHGHFKLVVECEVIGRGRRSLVVQSGRIYRFLIDEDDLHQ